MVLVNNTRTEAWRSDLPFVIKSKASLLLTKGWCCLSYSLNAMHVVHKP